MLSFGILLPRVELEVLLTVALMDMIWETSSKLTRRDKRLYWNGKTWVLTKAGKEVFRSRDSADAAIELLK